LLLKRPSPGGTDSTGAFSYSANNYRLAICYKLAPTIMKTLFLLRHAKAENGIAGSPDFDRTLNDRGRKEAQAVGTFIQKQNLVIDLVLSSSAKRARETTELVLASANLNVDVRYDQRIHEAGPLRLLKVVSQIEEDRSSVLLVGHNPGMEELLRLLTDRVEHLATGTLAKIDLKAARWNQALEEKGSLDWIVRPKELTED
jgi:phosphohistidine phosphatase